MVEKKKIALIINSAGDLCAVGDGCTISVYEGSESDWTEYSRTACNVEITGNLALDRESVGKLCEKMQDCTAVVSTSVNGLPYHMFDRAGLKIIEIERFCLDDLEYIDALIDEEAQGYEKMSLSPVSAEDDGNYFFDLAEVQSKHPDLSSKELLREFLENVPFISLELVCRHVPPWIEGLAEQKCMVISSSESKDGNVNVTIRRGCIADRS